MAQPRRLYEQIAQKITADIASGQFAIGQRLPSERDLAQAFNVSRPTIREAIIALELDSLVEVRLGSGVYVTNVVPPSGQAPAKDIGPFELLEARRAIEGEACAVAATRITKEQLAELSALVAEMRDDNSQDEIILSEEADRRFHELIATATQNTALFAAVEALWETRERSPQTHHVDDRARAQGSKPSIDEHATIVRALKKRDPEAARAAMHKHLTNVIERLLKHTEVREMQRLRETAAEKRRRYTPRG
jgi:DNA-binding FadR family transcriptional regulator